jgi:hypothetical protein
MIPGLTSKVSESLVACSTTISPKTDVIHINTTTATTVIATIMPPYGGFSGILVVINRSGGNVTTVTTGNIATAVTIGENVATVLIYSKIQNLWYPGALA